MSNAASIGARALPSVADTRRAFGLALTCVGAWLLIAGCDSQPSANGMASATSMAPVAPMTAVPSGGRGPAPAPPQMPVAGMGISQAGRPGSGLPPMTAAGAMGAPINMPPDVPSAGAAAPQPANPDYTVDGPLDGSCPDGFMPRSGRNSGFKHSSGDRDFIVYLPETSMDTPRPVFVGLTGTVQEEEQFVSRDGQLAPVLTEMGWIVLAPVRHCSTSGMSCYAEGSDGWIWYPWNDGSLDDKWAQKIGPDGEFVEAMTRCAAKQWPIDRRRIFIGGISAGGSFTYRNITYNSKFFAGGVPGSGMWYTDSDTGPLVPAGNQKLLMENPEGVFDGGCCPRPIKEHRLEPMIVIDLWGGDNDRWTNPMNNPMRELTFDYRPETQAASNYFATQKDNGVVYLACSGQQAHGWPGSALGRGASAREFNTWMANVLMAHPKGTKVADFKMPSSFPQAFSCVQGRYTDHYPQ